MSQYFNDAATGTTLWNPANRVAQLFVRMTEAMEPVAGQPCGIVDLGGDEYAVDLDVFTGFVDAVVTQYVASNHPVFKAMLAGYVLPAVVMVERSGRTVAALSAPVQRSTEAISVNVNAFDPIGDQHDLVERARAVARAMPS